jgi:hypothetical protein
MGGCVSMMCSYLYAYLCYLNESTCLVLISTVRNSEKFYELAEWKQKIDKSLRAAGALEAITKSVSRESYTASAVGVPGLVSFLYRHNALHQFTAPSLDPPYHTPAEQVLTPPLSSPPSSPLPRSSHSSRPLAHSPTRASACRVSCVVCAGQDPAAVPEAVREGARATAVRDGG